MNSSQSLSALDWQRQIYLNGFAGINQTVKINYEALESAAREKLSRKSYAYIAGGAGMESTMRNNRIALEACKIVPRMLRNVENRDTRIHLLGHTFNTPLFISPIGVLEMAHADADLAVARAASTLNIPYIFSNQASYPMEETAEVMGDSPRFFQLYWSKSRELVTSLIKRAEKCGCLGIIVTLDTTMLGWRIRDLDLASLPFLEGKGIAQYTSDPVFQQLMAQNIIPSTKQRISLKTIQGLIKMVNNYPGSGFLKKLKSGKPMSAIRHFTGLYSNAATTWEDLAWLRQQTSLPIILKGILAADDARKTLDYGMDGIFISNHGGRQVDGSVSSFEVLPTIAKIVKGKIPIIIDSGIRSGADVFKALAMGATAVSIGRPYVYGLALGGERGVYEVLRNFMSDFELTMGLSGCATVAEITSDCVTYA
ncbi:lactate 2-monooxygenase [Emticicia sp. BO119]|uniref:lactate 2-monooxygenase n=1 Tax=Emticicia sp. BO119 TaxID=2757768 RepID=UPI0015F01603|nr:lactate 2-monooxygenase [Emticicia sp. BO119]MBA4854047.1 alpha-hydroxy-acid oxidizing protein [Emticicia sp. BO119]